MALTREDIIKDKELVSALNDYGFRRNGESYDSKEEAIDSFLDDYRALQSNSVSAAKFISFVNNLDDEKPEDAEFKKNLSKLYKTVDEEVDEVFGDTTFGQKAEAIREYAQYTFLDPINLLGLGAGKLIAGTAGRAALKPLLARAFSSKAGAVATPAVAEAAIGAGQETLVQQAEQDLGAREDKSLAEIGTAGVVGGIAGGIAGGIGAKIAGGKRSAEIEKIAAENLENTAQGRGAKKETFGEALAEADETSKQQLNGSYGFVKDTVDLDEAYDPLAKIKSIDEANRTVELKFLPKGDEELGSITKTVSFDDFKLATEKQTKEAVDNYNSEYGKFLDKSNAKYESGRKTLEDAGLITMDELENTLGTSLTPEGLGEINDALIKILKDTDNPNIAAKVDKRERVTETLAELIGSGEDKIAQDAIFDKFIKSGISLDQVSALYRLDVSMSMAKGGKQSSASKMLDNGFLNTIDNAARNLTSEQRGLLKLIEQEKELERKMAQKFNVAIDVWRSFLVTQPATTMRNIIGSALRVPGQTLEAGLDNFFKQTDNKLLGYQSSVDTEFLNRNVFDLTKNLFNPEDAIPLTRLIANEFSQVDKQLFKQFDDYIPIEREGSGKFIRGLNKLSQWANVLNRQQDRAIKSASFLSELDAQVKLARNRGDITDTAVKGIDDILKDNKLNLLNDDMVSKSLDFAYKITYQTKRAGDDLVFGGRLVNNIQDSLNKSPILKTVIPFPNFLINSLVYTTNRLGGGALKLPKSAFTVISNTTKKGVANNIAKRQQLEQARQQFDELLQNPDQFPRTRKQELENEISDLETTFAKQTRELTRLKRGMVETTEGLALLGTAVVLREKFGGTEWYSLKDADGQERDFRPIFPLTPFLFLADLILKSMRDEPITEDLVLSGSEAAFGVTVRAGAIGNFSRNTYKRLSTRENDPIAAKELGKSLGSLLGYFLGGFATPLRPLEDVIQAGTGSKSIERRLQKDPFGMNVEVDYPVFQGIIDELAKNVVRGTPLEEVVFEDSKEFVTGTSDVTPDPVRAPIQKQLTGVTVMPTKTVVGEELAKLGIPEYKLNKYSQVPEYEYAFKKALGVATKEIVEPFINSAKYINAEPKEKQRLLNVLYFGKSVSDLDDRTRKSLTRRDGKTYNNVRLLASAMLKENFPYLDYLSKYRKSISGKDFADAAEIYKRQNPRVELDKIFTYVDERDPANEATIARNEKILDDIKNIARRRGSLSEEDFIDLQRVARQTGLVRDDTAFKDLRLSKREGGYVSQMNALGF